MIDINKVRASLLGTGGIDINGEYNWNGNYYFYITRDDGLKHNYCVNIYRIKNKRATVGWYLSINICFNAINSKEIELYAKKLKSLKGAQFKAIFEINNFEENEALQEKIFNKYFKNHAIPIFNIKDGDIKLIGTTYRSALNDMRNWNTNNYKWLYYNNDIPNYNNFKEVYTLEKKFWDEENKFFISKSVRYYNSYSSEGIENDELMNSMIDIVKNNEKYQYLFYESQSNS